MKIHRDRVRLRTCTHHYCGPGAIPVSRILTFDFQRDNGGNKQTRPRSRRLRCCQRTHVRVSGTRVIADDKSKRRVCHADVTRRARMLREILTLGVRVGKKKEREKKEKRQNTTLRRSCLQICGILFFMSMLAFLNRVLIRMLGETFVHAT